MPTEYTRKGNVQRGKWTEEDLIKAVEAVRNRAMGLYPNIFSFYLSVNVTETDNTNQNLDKNPPKNHQTEDQEIVSTSASSLNSMGLEPHQELSNSADQDTPGTLLDQFSPVPSTSSAGIQKVRKRQNK